MIRTTWAIVLALLVGCANAQEPAPSPLPARPTDAPATAAPATAAPATAEPQPRRVAAGPSDWPTFLGPTQDGVSTERGIIAPWPAEGLRKVWECELGVGLAPPAVADGRLFHFDRFEDNCRLTCRDAATGKFHWQYEFPTDYVDRYGYYPGPRACPLVVGERVYVYGPEGVLACVRVADGKELWKIDTVAKYHIHQNFFGVGSVPLIDGELLIVAIGGSPDGPRPFDFRQARSNGTAIVAFDKKTGQQKYAAGAELSSYASPVIRTLNGQKTGLYFARGGLLGFDPQTGATRFHYKWRAKIEESVNAANPVVVGDKVFLSECYGPGSSLIELKNGQPKEVWTDAEKDQVDKSMMCHWNTPIHHAGFVYGCSGRHDNEADLRCVELASGEVKWKKRRTFRCTLLMVDGYFVSLSEYGDLSLFRVNAEKYDEVSKYRVKELEYPCWAPPVLSHGLLYVRGKEKLLALELIPQK